jgi:hypothetical protein
LLRFKAEHGHLLPPLRRKIEAYTSEVAAIEDPDQREARKEVIALELSEDLQQVKEAMSYSWKQIVFEIIAPLAGAGGALYVADPAHNAIAAAAAGSAFLAACYQALSNANPERVAENMPLAYLAFADTKLRNA